MYKVVFKDGKYWISYNGNIVEDIDSFDEPVSPSVIIKEINHEV